MGGGHCFFQIYWKAILSKKEALRALFSLKNFSELYENLPPAERVNTLKRIIRDVVIREKQAIINIYGLGEFPL